MEDTFQSYKPVKLYYASFTTSEEHDMSLPPIILIHGFFACSNSWNRVKCNISSNTRRKVYTIDLRNHGRSEYSDEHTLKHLAADVIQFMKDENIKCATFIGHSLGGRVTMELALHKPELVENAIMEDIAFNDLDQEKMKNLKLFAERVYKTVSSFSVIMSEADACRMVNRISSRHMPKFSLWEGKPEIEKIFPFYKDKTTGQFKFLFNMDVVIKCLANPHLIKNDLEGDPTYAGRTLFVKGEYSIVPMDKEKENMLKYFPNAEFVTVKGGYHLVHNESTTEFVKVVCDFINSKQ